VSYLGIYAPAGTPVAIIILLHQEIVGVLNRVDVKERFFNSGVETVGNSPQEFAAIMMSDMARTGKMLKNAGIRDE
jgi:tripartite-type tricarboxylate transporter receptor subunit TctC